MADLEVVAADAMQWSICQFRTIGILFIFGRFQGFEMRQTPRQQAGKQHVQDAHLLLNYPILLC